MGGRCLGARVDVPQGRACVFIFFPSQPQPLQSSLPSLPQFGAAALASLPKDMAGALSRGALSMGYVRLWLKASTTPLLGALVRAFPGFRDRVLGNPRFLLVLAIEELIGCSARMAGEIQGRPGDRFWKEINFVASDMSLEVIGDFFIVWLLSPRACFAPRSSSAAARALAGLPAHCLQVGGYTLAQRLGALALRGAQFFAVGAGAAALGHSATVAMVERQKAAAAARGEKPPKLKKGETPPKELGPVLDTAAAWGVFMALSSNARYQLVNGLEERVLDPLPLPPLAKSAATFWLRFGNTFVGTVNWMWWAKLVGVQ